MVIVPQKAGFLQKTRFIHTSSAQQLQTTGKHWKQDEDLIVFKQAGAGTGARPTGLSVSISRRRATLLA
jgi:hypothetical protein